MNTDNLSQSVIFHLGEKQERDEFNGAVWVNRLTPADSASPVANVTFEPGCRNNWHKHAGGQILLVTGGRGYYQEWGKTAQELQAGDVINIPADVKHWHGAARDSWFVHIAVGVKHEKGPVTWLEPVSDEDYNKLK